MISRRTALALAEVYAAAFYSRYETGGGLYQVSSHRYHVEVEKLYDFLYSCNCAPWFCNLSKNTGDDADDRSRATRKLKEFIMKLHTGETQYDITPKWTWEQRQKLGQEYLE